MQSIHIKLAACLFSFTSSAAPLRVLFLGDNAGHKPTNRFALMQPALASRGIEMTYTDKLDDFVKSQQHHLDHIF